jgi:hypothetical protein
LLNPVWTGSVIVPIPLVSLGGVRGGESRSTVLLVVLIGIQFNSEFLVSDVHNFGGSFRNPTGTRPVFGPISRAVTPRARAIPFGCRRFRFRVPVRSYFPLYLMSWSMLFLGYSYDFKFFRRLIFRVSSLPGVHSRLQLERVLSSFPFHLVTLIVFMSFRFFFVALGFGFQ